MEIVWFVFRRMVRVKTLWLSNAKPGCTEHAPILSKRSYLVVFNRVIDVRNSFVQFKILLICYNTFLYNNFFSVSDIHVYHHNENINTHALIWSKPFCIRFAESTIHVITESLTNHNPYISDTVIEYTCTYLYMYTIV